MILCVLSEGKQLATIYLCRRFETSKESSNIWKSGSKTILNSDSYACVDVILVSDSQIRLNRDLQGITDVITSEMEFMPRFVMIPPESIKKEVIEDSSQEAFLSIKKCLPSAICLEKTLWKIQISQNK
ncbi:hypothetical protein CDAR_466051 [Caerostris darwini]|uniref:Uncharacterized protein n=1 Tax=Caerostris darwini TaxID=1538125 RepID=A0AAV4WN53_9ARAC|nr:hypothetical protein CDAR_466051 [Caerostris darwini]